MRKFQFATALALLLALTPAARATTTVEPISGAFPISILSGDTVAIGFELATDEFVADVTIQFIYTTLTIDVLPGACVDLGALNFNCVIDDVAGTVTITAGDILTGPWLANGQDLANVSFTSTGGAGLVNLGIQPGTFFTACDLLTAPCINPTASSFDNQGVPVAIVTPEPGSAALLGLGLAGLAWASGRPRHHS